MHFRRIRRIRNGGHVLGAQRLDGKCVIAISGAVLSTLPATAQLGCRPDTAPGGGNGLHAAKYSEEAPRCISRLLVSLWDSLIA